MIAGYIDFLLACIVPFKFRTQWISFTCEISGTASSSLVDLVMLKLKSRIRQSFTTKIVQEEVVVLSFHRAFSFAHLWNGVIEILQLEERLDSSIEIPMPRSCSD